MTDKKNETPAFVPVFERDVPIPPLARRPPERRGRLAYLRRMTPGDSVLVTGETEVAVRNAAIYYLGLRRFVVRSVEGGVRVWCIPERRRFR